MDVSPFLMEKWHPQLDDLRWRASLYPGGRQTMCEQLWLASYSEPLDYPAQHGSKLCIDRVHKNPHTEPSWAMRCLRPSTLAMPTLLATQARPDTRTNAFCLSCHTSNATLTGMRMDALTPGIVPRFQDPRRQPMNVPAVMGGFVPGWVNGGVTLPDGTRTLDQHFDHFPAP